MAADPARRLVPGPQDDTERVIAAPPPATSLPAASLRLRGAGGFRPSPARERSVASDLAEQRPGWHNLRWRALASPRDRTQRPDASYSGQLGSTPRRAACRAGLPCLRDYAVGGSRLHERCCLGLLLRRDRRAGRVRAAPCSRAQRRNRSSHRQDIERRHCGRAESSRRHRRPRSIPKPFPDGAAADFRIHRRARLGGSIASRPPTVSSSRS